MLVVSIAEGYMYSNLIVKNIEESVAVDYACAGPSRHEMGEFTLHLFLRCKQYKKYFVDAEARENLYKNPEISRELSQEAISEVGHFHVLADKLILHDTTLILP